MVKTATRPKPIISKKTEATGTATPHGAADIRLIPLDQLEPSLVNVRKVAASVSDDAGRWCQNNANKSQDWPETCS